MPSYQIPTRLGMNLGDFGFKDASSPRSGIGLLLNSHDLGQMPFTHRLNRNLGQPGNLSHF